MPSFHNNLPEYLSTCNRLVEEIYVTLPEHRHIVREIVSEIFSEEFIGIQHSRRHARNKGCKGPMCQKALRDWQRQRTMDKAIREGRKPTAYKRSPEARTRDYVISRIASEYECFWTFRRTATWDPVKAAHEILEIFNEWDNGVLPNRRLHINPRVGVA